jgi:hypothetical protein
LAIPTHTLSAGLVVSVAAVGRSFDNNEYTDYDSGPVAGSQVASTSGGRSAKGTTASSSAYGNLFPDLLNPGPGLRLRANTLAVGGDVAQTNAWAVTQWGDTIRIGTTLPLPSTLAVTFSIEGLYGYTLVPSQQ